jgi:hypothetical protein
MWDDRETLGGKMTKKLCKDCKWLHSAYLTGYNMGRLSETKVGLTDNED